MPLEKSKLPLNEDEATKIVHTYIGEKEAVVRIGNLIREGSSLDELQRGVEKALKEVDRWSHRLDRNTERARSEFCEQLKTEIVKQLGLQVYNGDPAYAKGVAQFFTTIEPSELREELSKQIIRLESDGYENRIVRAALEFELDEEELTGILDRGKKLPQMKRRE